MVQGMSLLGITTSGGFRALTGVTTSGARMSGALAGVSDGAGTISNGRQETTEEQAVELTERKTVLIR